MLMFIVFKDEHIDGVQRVENKMRDSFEPEACISSSAVLCRNSANCFSFSGTFQLQPEFLMQTPTYY